VTAPIEPSTPAARIPHGYGSLPLAGLLLATGVYLYAGLFTITGTPFLLGGDQVFFWTNAQRALYGELIYRDFHEVTPPGTDLVYLAAYELFGARIWIPNLVVLLLGLALCWICFHVASLVMKRSQAALASSIVTVVFYGQLLNATHHWFSLLAVMAALAVLMPARSAKRVALAGALLGIACFFTQTRGVAAAAGIAIFLMWEGARGAESWWWCLRRQAQLVVPMALTWAAVSSYYIARVGLERLWYFQVTYVPRYRISLSNTFSFGTAEVLKWLELPATRPAALVYFAIPIIYAICLSRCWRRTLPGAREPIALLALVGVAMFLEIAQIPSWLRLYCVAMPAAILLVWLLIDGAGKHRAYAAQLAWLAWIVVIGAACYQTSSRHLRPMMIADLPAGRVAATPVAAQKLAWLAQRISPGQFVFQAAWPSIYLPLAVRNPVFLDNLDTGYTIRPEYQQLTIRQLEAGRVQYILWSPQLELPSYPFAEFRQFLGERYRPVRSFADQDVLWERK
jgi:hypothetical protein